MRNYSFNTAYTHAMDLYGVEVHPVDFENIGLIAWDRIGNRNTRLYTYIVEPTEAEDGGFYIDLPCNCDIIEAVTANYEDYQKTNPMQLSGNMIGGWTESYIEARKFNVNHLYPSGKYIKYHREDNRIYLSELFSTVHILYKGVLADDDGLPKLNEKELDAIACFIAYSDYYKKALVTRDPSTFQLAKDLENKWTLKCTQARVPDYINQNEMDEILNVTSSWDRKRFGKSFKPIR